MLDFTKVKRVVSGWWESVTGRPSPQILCAHTHKFIDQTWQRVADKRYVLKNRFICTHCNSNDLRDIE